MWGINGTQKLRSPRGWEEERGGTRRKRVVQESKEVPSRASRAKIKKHGSRGWK